MRRGLIKLFALSAKLKREPRRGWQTKVGVALPESVADHTFLVTAISMVLGDLRGMDTCKMMRLSILHDLAEALMGDMVHDALPREAKRKLEGKALAKMLSTLPPRLRATYLSLWDELLQEGSPEAQLVWQIDKFEMALQAKIYERDGFSRKKLKEFVISARRAITDEQLRRGLASMEEHDLGLTSSLLPH